MQDVSLGENKPVDSQENVSIKSLAVVQTRTIVGVNALSVRVEVHLANGLPSFSTVGLPETTVKESRDRVRSAILNSGFEFPAKRITVNLAPADLPKTGGRFDLPIAIGVLVASGQLKVESLGQYEMVGELALDGSLQSVSGILSTALACKVDGRALILPTANSAEAALSGSECLYHAGHLLQLCRHFSNRDVMPLCEPLSSQKESLCASLDLSDVKGQPFAKRALEIAASGEHSLLFIGPPGTGKSMLASRLSGILPELTVDDAMEVAAIHSLVDGSFDVSSWRKRPHRSPHHSASAVALVGGGSYPKPGEITLAHHGTLFLDELTEYSRSALEQLREPLEAGRIDIARANQSIRYPAKFMLIAACNPCRCGFYGDGTDRCGCSVSSLDRYRSKLSGPMLDRIDMHIPLSRVSVSILQSYQGVEEASDVVKQRVVMVRQVQMERQGKLNSKLLGSEVDRFCDLERPLLQFFEQACDKLMMSARAYHRVLRLARTIADMDHSNAISKHHLMEALNLRCLDRTG